MLIDTYESIKEYLWYESKCPVCEIADFQGRKAAIHEEIQRLP